MDFLHQWIVPTASTAAPAVYIVTAVIALLLTSVSKGGFGGGVGMVSVPLMLVVIPSPHFVIGLWLPVLIACDVVTIGSYPRQWSPWVFAKLAPGMLLGIGLATLLLGGMSRETASHSAALQQAWLKLAIAAIALVFLVFQLRSRPNADRPPWEPTWRASIPVGIAGGITTTLAHAAGTIINMYLIPQKLPKEVFVGTCGRFYFIFNSIKVPFMLAVGVITLGTLKYGLWLMMLGPLGVWLGKWINTRISPKWFVRLIYTFLVLAAGKLVYDWGKVVLWGS